MSMPEVVRRTIAQAIKLLDASGAKYKIIDQEGNEYGTLTVSKPKKLTKTFVHPPGTMWKYYYPMLKDMNPGDVVVVPAGEFDPKRLQGAITGWACATWGLQAYKTCVVGSNVEILRCS